MRRIGQTIFVLSVFLVVGTAITWMKTYRHGWFYNLKFDHASINIDVVAGRWRVVWQNWHETTASDSAEEQEDHQVDIQSIRFHFLDHHKSMEPEKYRTNYYELATSLSMPLTFFAFIGLCFERSVSKSVRPGCCKKCGYDLRASVDRCPECGGSIIAR